MKIKVKLLDEKARKPSKAHVTDAGFDIYANSDVIVYPGQVVKIPTGFSIHLPDNHFMHIVDRSSMALNGLKVLGGIIDSEYRGQVHVLMTKLTAEPYKIERFDKIAQGLVLPGSSQFLIELSSVLDETSRGSNGFGSTGK